jgi:rod shape-determining protein MreC
MTPLPLIGGHWGAFVFVVAALGLLGFSIASPQTAQGVRTGFADLVTPVLMIVSKPVQDSAVFVRNITGISQLQAENERLAKENTRLREWYQTALILESENKSLRELLNVKIEPQNRYVSARVLADPGHSFVKSLLVAAGEKDGVRKGQAVISGNGLVGRIIESGRQSARVLLVTDMNSRVPVLVEDSSQHAILAGGNDGLPMLVHLPPGSEMEAGARIITSGHGGIFPKGLPVGRVVIDSDGRPHVELYADFDRMTYVRVIDRPEDPNLIGNTQD